MILGDEEITMMERYLDVQLCDLEGSYDLAFVFGTKANDFIPQLSELLGRERVKRVLLTGGTNKSTGLVESLEHQKLLLDRGISVDRIITETKSKNTQENVSLGLEKLWSLFRYQEINSILVISKWYHSRRALMTLKAQIPKHIEISNLSYEPAECTRADWWKANESLWLVTKEWKTIPKYKEFGHLAEI